MIDFFETSVRIYPSTEFFSFIDSDGRECSYSYWQARLISASLARKLQFLGLREGDTVMVDLPNCPEFVFFSLAAAYAGLTLVLVDNDLNESAKLSRTMELERAGVKVAFAVDEDMARHMLRCVRSLSADDSDIVRNIFADSRRSRSIMGESQDFIDDTVHFAERAAHLFDRDQTAVMLFKGGRNSKTGKRDKLKIVPLTWNQLLDSSSLVNEYLTTGASRLWQERLPFNSFSMSDSTKLRTSSPDFIWQCALPLSGIDGFQTMVRSVEAKTPFRLYVGDDAEYMLYDAEMGYVTHVAVDDALLQDMLTVEEWRNDEAPGLTSRLSKYQCLILVGSINARTMKRAYDLGTRIFTSYSAPETSGIIAATMVTPDYQGGIAPIEGYEIHIVDPDDEEYGRLAIKGPGLFDGYLNTRTALTVDRFFMTDTKAALIGGKLFFRNRSDNMFVSAGQNIYPVEIADVLRHVSGVAGVHVFGVNDSRCGMLPVAVIERDNPTLTPKMVEDTTRSWFSNISVPISIFVFDKLPRTNHGKLDRSAIEAFFT